MSTSHRTKLPAVGSSVLITEPNPWAGYTGRVVAAATVTINRTWHIARVMLDNQDGTKVFVEHGEWEPFVRMSRRLKRDRW